MSQTKIGVGMINASSIGDAKVLQGDGSWVTPSAGAMTFISNTDISSAATYDFESFTAASYEHYLFVLQNLIPATDAVHLWVRTSTDGGTYDAGASDYHWGNFRNAWVHDLADAQISLTGVSAASYYTIGSAANEQGVNGNIWLHAPHATSYTTVLSTTFYQNSDGQIIPDQNGGMRLSAADVDGFRLLFSSGNIESGTVTAYGLANS